MFSLTLRWIAFLMSFSVTRQKIEDIVDALAPSKVHTLEFVAPANIKIATAAVSLRPHKHLKSYVDEIAGQISCAVSGGAQLVLFPEQTSLSGLGLLSKSKYPKVIEAFFENAESAQMVIDRLHNFLYELYFNMFSLLAKHYRVYLAGSAYVVEDGRVYHRAFVFAPDGSVAGTQDKMHGIADLLENLTLGEKIQPIETKIGSICILPGNDPFFYECVKIAAGLGAQIILNPALGTDIQVQFMRDINICRADECRVHIVNCTLTGEGLPLAGGEYVCAPIEVTKERDGMVSMQYLRPDVAVVRLDLNRAEQFVDVYLGGENPAFYQKDFVSSYSFAGSTK